MRNIFLAGAALLSLSTVSGLAIAQDMGAPAGQPPMGSMTPPADPAPGAMPATPPADPAQADPAQGAMPATPPADPSMGTPGAPPPAADPNAGQPTGAVPADPGMTPAPAGMPRDPAAPMGSAANPATVGGNMTPPPTDEKDYPVCSKTVQDSCVNPGEARKMRKRR